MKLNGKKHSRANVSSFEWTEAQYSRAKVSSFLRGGTEGYTLEREAPEDKDFQKKPVETSTKS